MVKASIAATTEVADEKATLHMIRVSGTLKSLRTKISNRQKKSRDEL
jgi:RNase P/RNase MRP subunit POP5